MKTKALNRIQRGMGFTMVEIIAVLMVLAVLAVIFLPQLNRRSRRCGINCANNLKQLSLGMRQWSMDNNDKMPMQVGITNGGAKEWIEAGAVWPAYMVMSNELNTPKVLFCPEDRSVTRTQATTFALSIAPSSTGTAFNSDNNTSYFIALDPDETHPERLMVGDSNLELNKQTVAHGFLNLWTNAPVGWDKSRHEKQRGNITLSDGSVQSYGKLELQALLAKTLMQTNRLLIP